MNPRIKRILLPLLLGLLAMLPFMIMEVVNLGRIPDPFPFAIFLYLWLMFALLIMSLSAILHLAKSKLNRKERFPALLLNALVIVFCAISIITLLVDQMPCFLGLPNCD